MTWLFFVLPLLAFCANSGLAHGDHGDHGGSRGVKGGQHGIKSYGGYFNDHGNGQGQGNNFLHSQQFHQQQNPYVYQPYGWNYNQPQRTYGGVIQQNYPNQQQQQQGFGWVGNGNQIGNQNPNGNGQAPFPKSPSLFLPNFTPPVYFPNAFPYPSFPQYNPFQFTPPFNNHNGNGNFGGHNNHGQNNGNFGQNAGGVQNQLGINGQGVGTNDQGQESSNRVDSENDGFATNAFFGAGQEGSDKVHREWTEDDESKWQATTKAPYFENKVPGLDCVLPAAAVLGAMTALKVSSLLPLEIPIGKPILSCNATQLLQAQINLDGIIYDCNRAAITKSCPRINSNNLLVDECQGETLECDVRMKQNTMDVSCTNGTLISNYPIVCKSASLMARKNVLNCLYKNSSPSYSSRTTRLPSHLADSLTTARPLIAPSTSILPPPRNNENNDGDENVINRVSEDDKKTKESLGLHHDVHEAIKDVFPHGLLSILDNKIYLPPHSSAGRKMPDDLKEQMVGVFPHELFALSQRNELSLVEDSRAVDSRLSVTRTDGIKNNQNTASFTENSQSKWNVNVNNRNTGNSGTSFKTNPNRLPQRFGGIEEDDVNDRLIFSP